VPPVAALDATPFGTMTESILASYTGFRYYPELVSADVAGSNVTEAVLAFRSLKGGSMAGMTRFEAHLDDMPSFGLAWAALWSDHLEDFWLLLHGHSALYASRGTFNAPEQLTFLADSLGVLRDQLWEYVEGGIDACVPSLMLLPLATRWSLALEHFDFPGSVWLAKGAPRRWFNETAGGFSAAGMPTRAGHVSFSASTAPADPSSPSAPTAGTFNVTFAPPPYVATAAGYPETLTLIVRIRSPDASHQLSGVTLAAGSSPSARLLGFSAANETATVTIATADGPATVNLVASFAPPSAGDTGGSGRRQPSWWRRWR
jgi:hypothetical protein